MHEYDHIGVTNPTGLSSGSLGFSLLTDNAMAGVPPAFRPPSQQFMAMEQSVSQREERDTVGE